MLFLLSSRYHSIKKLIDSTSYTSYCYIVLLLPTTMNSKPVDLSAKFIDLAEDIMRISTDTISFKDKLHAYRDALVYNNVIFNFDMYDNELIPIIDSICDMFDEYN